ncbi:MAG: 3-hydroxyacyl-ACP dehydratase FabZ family protein [Phycisphaerales bacterium JB038]
MAIQPLFDLSRIDLSATRADRAQICARIPHRDQMLLIDRIIWADESTMSGVGERVIREDEFWTSGHFPEAPVLPGVLMIESAAQLGCWIWMGAVEDPRTLGLVRVDDVALRGSAEPGDTLLFMAKGVRWNHKRMIVRNQAVKRDNPKHVIFEATITGMPLRNGAADSA